VRFNKAHVAEVGGTIARLNLVVAASASCTLGTCVCSHGGGTLPLGIEVLLPAFRLCIASGVRTCLLLLPPAPLAQIIVSSHSSSHRQISALEVSDAHHQLVVVKDNGHTQVRAG
jgi:hypothetical protein